MGGDPVSPNGEDHWARRAPYDSFKLENDLEEYASREKLARVTHG